MDWFKSIFFWNYEKRLQCLLTFLRFSLKENFLYDLIFTNIFISIYAINYSTQVYF